MLLHVFCIHCVLYCVVSTAFWDFPNQWYERTLDETKQRRSKINSFFFINLTKISFISSFIFPEKNHLPRVTRFFFFFFFFFFFVWFFFFFFLSFSIFFCEFQFFFWEQRGRVTVDFEALNTNWKAEETSDLFIYLFFFLHRQNFRISLKSQN